MVSPRVQSRKGWCSRSLFQKRCWKQCYPFCCVIFFWVIMCEVRRNYNEMNELLRMNHDMYDQVKETNSKEYEKANDKQSIRGTSSSAFCLLIKDDNEILSEWIAYHYHLFRMRRLIVAVDPTSETSPKQILDSWHKNFGLDYTLWNDEDYATDYFVHRDYSKIPVRDGIKIANNNNNTKSINAKNVADFLNNPVLLSSYVVRNSGEKDGIKIDETYVSTHQNEIRRDLLQASLHLFRQKNFVSECYRTIKLEGKLNPFWVAHTDTDEYLVPHPWIAHQLHNNTSLVYKGRGKPKQNPFQQQDLRDIFPKEPTEGSLWTFYETFVGSDGYETATLNLRERAGCVVMPRIDFGSNEEIGGTHTTTVTTNSPKQTTTVSWNHSKFESLRWKFHGDFTKTKLAPKTIVDVHHLSEDDDIWTTKLIGSVHRPSNRGCIPPEKQFKSRYQYMQPLAVYHYLGSLERYLSRTDVRRNAKKYFEKNIPSNYAEGDENLPDRTKNAARWWMKGWFDSFVATHGATKVYKVLGKEYASKSTTTI